MSLFFSLDGRPFLTNGADEWKPYCCMQYDRLSQQQLSFLLELVDIWLCYCEKQNSELFWNTVCMQGVPKLCTVYQLLLLLFNVADSRYRGRGPPNDVGPSSTPNISKPSPDPGSSNVAGQSSRSGPAARQSNDPSTRMRNGPIGGGSGAGKAASNKVQNGQ